MGRKDMNTIKGSTVFILGNKINIFPSYRALYDYVRLSIGKTGCEKNYVTVNNVHTMMEGFHDASFRQILNESFLSLPDGKPLEIMGKLKGAKGIARLFGPTVMEKFIDWGRQDNIRHFFFGSDEANLERLKQAILSKFPGTIISGMLAPPFKPTEEWNNDYFIAAINEVQADFIWVGLGAPKQERWMYTHTKKINGLLLGIGAGFDYMAGNTQHAPLWMKNGSLEWAYRLAQEPGRLWRRYLTTIPPFILFASLELFGVNFRKEKRSTPQP